MPKNSSEIRNPKNEDKAAPVKTRSKINKPLFRTDCLR